MTVKQLRDGSPSVRSSSGVQTYMDVQRMSFDMRRQSHGPWRVIP